MIRFENDYAEGAHPRILKRLVETNEEQAPGYGTDEYCEQARQAIRKACGNENVDVHFLVGGTQANKVVIASMLRPHQGVISPITGHIFTHETGAIEALGHKILTLPSWDGKITAAGVKELYEEHHNSPTSIHTTQPGMVYISQSTESGTIYSKSELVALSNVCRECGLPLFMDGARLGYALAGEGNDLSLADIAELCDVFYIGGTKVGALFGEAVVITNDAFKKDFRYFIKQNGGLLAKGRLLGLQFETLFKDNLYYEISRHAVEMATMIKQAFIEKGIPLKYETWTNQHFPILSTEMLTKLSKKYAFSIWEPAAANHTVVRFCTSWATKKENVELLIEDIKKL